MKFRDLCDVKDTLASIVQIEAKIKAETGLGLNHAFAVCCLSKGDMSAGDLANRLRIAAPSLSRVLKVLESQNVITTKSDTPDARVKLLTLTDKGHTVSKQLETLELSWFPHLVDLTNPLAV